MFQGKVINEKVFEFKRVNSNKINKAIIKILVTFYKANITSGIIYLIILIIYALFLDFIIKVQVIIQNKE